MLTVDNRNVIIHINNVKSTFISFSVTFFLLLLLLLLLLFFIIIDFDYTIKNISIYIKSCIRTLHNPKVNIYSAERT
jgi:hypothetical protein